MASTDIEPDAKVYIMFQVEENIDRLKPYKVTLPINGNTITLEVDTFAATKKPSVAEKKNQKPGYTSIQELT